MIRLKRMSRTRPVRELRAHAPRDGRAVRRRLRRAPGSRSRRGGFSPAVDVFYAGDPPRAVVHAELAGIDPDEIGLEIEGRELVIAGHRRPADAEGRVYQQLEIDFGPFRRVIPLGADVVADEAQGHLPRTASCASSCRSRGREARSRSVPIERRAASDDVLRASVIEIQRRAATGRDVEVGAPRELPGALPVLPLRETVAAPRHADAAGRRPGALGAARQRRARRQPDARHGRLARTPSSRRPGPDDALRGRRRRRRSRG